MPPYNPLQFIRAMARGSSEGPAPRPPGSGSYGYNSFMKDLADLTRRRAEDRDRTSLFEKVSPGNVGNVFNVEPSPLQFANTNTMDAYGRPVRILEVVGEDVLGEMICVSIQQETILDSTQFQGPIIPGLNDILEGPLIGIVEFGAGAGLSTFEFDVPPPVSFPGFVAQDDGVGGFRLADLSVARRVNGAMLTLPASSMRVFVRNDANAPYLINVGRNVVAPLNADPRAFNQLNKAPAIVRVHATYGRRTTQSNLTRTYPICFNQSTGGNSQQTTPFNANISITFNIPTYAKRVFFPRDPLNTTTLSIQFMQPQYTGGGGEMFLGPTIVAAGSIGPVEISPNDAIIRITNPLGQASIANMLAVFELGI